MKQQREVSYQPLLKAIALLHRMKERMSPIVTLDSITMHKQIPSISDNKCQQIMDKVAEFPKPARVFPRIKNTTE
jgi:hypothetical protein